MDEFEYSVEDYNPMTRQQLLNEANDHLYLANKARKSRDFETAAHHLRKAGDYSRALTRDVLQKYKKGEVSRNDVKHWIAQQRDLEGIYHSATANVHLQRGRRAEAIRDEFYSPSRRPLSNRHLENLKNTALKEADLADHHVALAMKKHRELSTRNYANLPSHRAKVSEAHLVDIESNSLRSRTKTLGDHIRVVIDDGLTRAERLRHLRR